MCQFKVDDTVTLPNGVHYKVLEINGHITKVQVLPPHGDNIFEETHRNEWQTLDWMLSKSAKKKVFK